MWLKRLALAEAERQLFFDSLKPPYFKRNCICQGKVDTKNTIALEAQFGLVLNWAFVAQSGRRSLVIIVMNILVQQFRNILGCR